MMDKREQELLRNTAAADSVVTVLKDCPLEWFELLTVTGEKGGEIEDFVRLMGKIEGGYAIVQGLIFLGIESYIEKTS